VDKKVEKRLHDSPPSNADVASMHLHHCARAQSKQPHFDRSPDSPSPYSRIFPLLRAVISRSFVWITVAGPPRLCTGFPFIEMQNLLNCH